jgi:hypothetical protein
MYLGLPNLSLRSFGGLNYIASLFALTGANGFWGDESDFSTLFQDSAGTTAVTMVEQPIGLMLDKHLGAVRGPNLISSGTTGWASSATYTSTIAAVGSELQVTPTANYGSQIQAIATVVGKPYIILADVRKVSGTQSCYVTITDSAGTADTLVIGTAVPAAQTTFVPRSTFFIAANSVTYVALRGTSTSTFTGEVAAFANISVRLVDGNHATQATAANRMVLSARVNLIQLDTRLLTSASWTKTTCTVVAGISDPFGGTKAFNVSALSAGDQIYQSLSVGTHPSMVTSVWLRRTAGSGSVRVKNPNGLSDTTAALDGTWQRFTSSATSDNAGLIYPGVTFTNAGDAADIYVPQINNGIVAAPTQWSDTAASYDTAGFPLYASANGTNQNMTTTTGGGGATGFFFCQATNPAGRGVALATPVNAAFATALTGGTLAAGTYYYCVSAINAYGETLASAETSQVTTGTTSTVTVNWGAVSGATGYKVYGRTTAGELLIATVGAVTTYIDTGAITPSGALPAANTTAYTVLWSDAGTNSGYKVVTNYAGNLLLQAGNGTAYTAATSTDVLALSTGAVVMVWDDGTNLNAQIGSGTVFTAARPVVTAGTAATTIASDNGVATGFFNGNLYPEVYGKNTAFTAAQRAQVQLYCKGKAGL